MTAQTEAAGLPDSAQKCRSRAEGQRLAVEHRGRVSRRTGMSSGSIVVPDGFVIRPMGRADTVATAHAHVRSLPVGLFPRMGERFLRRWHRTLLRLPYGVALVVTDSEARGGEVVAFLFGTTDQAGQIRALLRNRRILVELIVCGGLALVRRPRLAAHFARTRGRPWLRKLLGRRGDAVGQPGDSNRATVAVLAAVAVEPDARGRGLGVALVREFLAQAQDRGAEVAELVTVVPAEGGAGAPFYERLGWRRTGDRRTRDGTTVRTYIYPLTTSARPPGHEPETERENV